MVVRDLAYHVIDPRSPLVPSHFFSFYFYNFACIISEAIFLNATLSTLWENATEPAKLGGKVVAVVTRTFKVVIS